jgi:hypothetical protein
VRFSIDTSRLDAELRRRYAEAVERDTQSLMAKLGEEFKGYRCEVHGEQLTIEISWGPNIYTGVIAGYRLEGCCSAFEEEIYRAHFPDKDTEPMQLADEVGVRFRQGCCGGSGVTWSEITRVVGYLIKKVGILVVLECGPEQCFRLHDHLPGFSQVVDQITARLPGIDPCWLGRIKARGMCEEGVQVWPAEQKTSADGGRDAGSS